MDYRHKFGFGGVCFLQPGWSSWWGMGITCFAHLVWDYTPCLTHGINTIPNVCQTEDHLSGWKDQSWGGMEKLGYLLPHICFFSQAVGWAQIQINLCWTQVKQHNPLELLCSAQTQFVTGQKLKKKFMSLPDMKNRSEVRKKPSIQYVQKTK